MNENKDQSAGNLQRSIQQEQDGRDAASPAEQKGKSPVQARGPSTSRKPPPARHKAA